jgi:hypothetical protein
VRCGEGFIRELCIALEHRWNPDAIFMIFTAYFDEADTHGAAPHIIMAGFLGDGRQWQLFMRRLRRMQKDDGFNIFHATEFKHHAGEFSDWSGPKSFRFVYKLTDLVEMELDQGITFDLKHKTYISGYRNTPNPKGIPYDSQYGLCFRCCLSYLVNKLVATRKKHRLHVVLERGHNNARNCEKIFEETKLTLRAKGLDLLGTFTRLRGGWTAIGAERALSARRSSRHQRNALTGEPDSEPQLGARAGPFPLVLGSPRVSG